jgi:hypothetical protein
MTNPTVRGVQIDKGIYDISGFELRFFTEKEIHDLMKGFEMLWIGEENEEPVNLYIVFSKKICYPVPNGNTQTYGLVIVLNHFNIKCILLIFLSHFLNLLFEK